MHMLFSLFCLMGWETNELGGVVPHMPNEAHTALDVAWRSVCRIIGENMAHSTELDRVLLPQCIQECAMTEAQIACPSQQACTLFLVKHMNISWFHASTNAKSFL